MPSWDLEEFGTSGHILKALHMDRRQIQTQFALPVLLGASLVSVNLWVPQVSCTERRTPGSPRTGRCRQWYSSIEVPHVSEIPGSDPEDRC